MAKEFNIHGGYFSPPGFLKVETGGSHDENPNGGVQIGVDEQGIPNMLEEGEPVYDDYVYSDNITADKSILEQFHLPEKYAGKLYSEIADAFVDEAEDRPLDPISNNGLRVMLGRLANAQEQQKANQEQDEIEKELADMSPEELTELEQILTAQEQNQQVGGEQIVVPEQFQPTQESLGFANGGPLRETSADAIKFADVLAKSSGNLVDDVKSIPAYYLDAHRRGDKELIDSAYPSDSKADKKSAREHVRLMLLRRADELKKSEQTKMMKDGGFLRKFEFGGDKDDRAAEVIAEAARKRAAQQAAIDALNKDAMLESSRKTALRTAENKVKRLQRYVERDEKTARRMERDAVKVYPADMAGYKQLLSKQYGLVDYNKKRLAEAQAAYDALTNDGTSPLMAIPGAVVEQNIGFDDAPNPTPARNHAGGQITDDDIDWGFARGGRLNVFDKGSKMLKNDPMTSLPNWTSERHPSMGAFNYQLHNNIPFVFDPLDIDTGLLLGVRQLPNQEQQNSTDVSTGDSYATWRRFAGLGHNLFAAGVNAFQQPNHYDFPMLRAMVPEIRMPDYIDPVSQPIDSNRAVNDILATNAGAVRAALASGAGPSVGALLTAIDNNTTKNLGSARESIAQYNNNQNNSVIGQRNQIVGQRAGLLYDLANSRSQALSMNNRLNLQTLMRNQIMNDQAEQQWADAVGTPLNYFAKGLSDLEWENINRNMANSMYDYWIDSNGHVHYYKK